MVSNMLIQFETRQLIGGIMSGGWTERDSEDIIVYCNGSWSGEERVGGWATVAFKDKVLVSGEAGFSDPCDSVLEAEIAGIVAGIKYVGRLNG